MAGFFILQTAQMGFSSLSDRIGMEGLWVIEN